MPYMTARAFGDTALEYAVEDIIAFRACDDLTYGSLNALNTCG
jgi:hypothetical protein